jgi:hypothetical protein
MRLMSASIAATAVMTAVRAAIRPRMAADRPAIPSLALRALSMKPAASARGSAFERSNTSREHRQSDEADRRRSQTESGNPWYRSRPRSLVGHGLAKDVFA